jgi:hypothetical protein
VVLADAIETLVVGETRVEGSDRRDDQCVLDLRSRIVVVSSEAAQLVDELPTGDVGSSEASVQGRVRGTR